MSSKLIIAVVAALSTGLAIGQEMTAKSGTGTLLNIYQTPRTDAGNNQFGLMDKKYEIRVDDPAGKDGFLVFLSVCQDNAFKRCPTDFTLGDPIQFHIDKKSMILSRSSGKELKTKVIQLRHVAQTSK
jgi:hypothetical protein